MKFLAKVLFVSAAVCLFSVLAVAQEMGVDELFNKLKAYNYGQDSNALAKIEQMGLRAGQAECEQLADRLAAIITSDVSYAAKDFACRQLARIGSAKQVPALAKMLSDKNTAEIARYALSQIGGTEVDNALLAELEKIEAELKAVHNLIKEFKRVDDGVRARVGIINTLGNRRAAVAVKKLDTLLNDENADIAAASALSLGRIANAEAVECLKKAFAQANSGLQQVILQAYLEYAEKSFADGNASQAEKMYSELFEGGQLPMIRAAALRGLVNIKSQKAAGLVMAAMQDKDSIVSIAAISLVRIVEPKDETGKLAAELAKLDAERSVLLIEALADRGDAAACSAVADAVKRIEPEVRIAAIEALGKIGDTASVKLLISTAAKSENAAEKKAAVASLKNIGVKGADETIADSLKNADSALRVQLIQVLAERNATECTGTLMKYAEDKDVKVSRATLKAIGKLGTEKNFTEVVGLVAKMENENVRSDAEDAAAKIAIKCDDKNKCADVVLNALKKEKSITVKCSLMRVLGGIGNDKALVYMQNAVKDENKEIKETAIRQLCNWQSTAALDNLFEIIKTSGDEKFRALAFRGYLRILAAVKDVSDPELLKMYQRISEYASGPEDVKLLLSGLSNVDGAASLKMVEKYLDDKDVSAEANMAADKIISRIKPVSIFDGKTFNGWEGNLKVFRIEDGAIVGGSLQHELGNNEFLCTTKEYSDFELHLTFKLLGPEKSANGGIQIRTRRIPNNFEVIGYQADMGQEYWGGLYDEMRRQRTLAKPDWEEMKKVIKYNDWNDYVIRCLGRHVQLWINGFQTVNYVEEDKSLEQKGIIGLQIHRGLASEAWYKDITIKDLSN